MGRGDGSKQQANVSPGLREEGEIELTDAETLESVSGLAARDEQASSYGTPEDTRAIGRIIARLQAGRTMSGADSEMIEDRAIDLYNSLCELISSDRASPQQLAQAATLFGEEPDALQARLS